MKTKIFLFIFLSALVWSCSSEPEFPDPGFDKTRTAVDTVRRDTIDIYTLKMDISAPNGVKTMQILNGRDYTLVDEVSKFNGQTDFTFEYDIDLTAINQDTIIQYVVKVVDNSMRSYNKGFILNVKDFSKPVISIPGIKDVMGLVSPVFELKAKFETGMNSIDSYKVVLDGQTLDEKAITDTVMYEMKYKHVIKADLKQGVPSKLTIQLKDSKGTVNNKDIQLNLIEMKKPTKFTISDKEGLDSEFDLMYDEKGRLTRMFRTLHTSHLGPDGHEVPELHFGEYVFIYNDKGQLEKWEEWYLDDKGEERVEMSNDMNFFYDEQGRFKEAYDSEESTYSRVRVGEYYPDGRPKSYYKGNNTVAFEDIHYTPELDGNGYVFTEILHPSNESDRFRQHQVDMTAVQIPTYFPELPPLSTYMGKGWDHIFTRKYVFERSIYTYRDPEEEASKNTYSTDASGRLTQLRNVSGSGWYAKEYIYVFNYDEEE